MTAELLVLVPRVGTPPALMIDAGSGIVTAGLGIATADRSSEYVLVYFEGNRFGAENLRTFAERVRCAAGRLIEHYPTIARGLFAREDFLVVGTWDGDHLDITDAATVAAWEGR